MKAMRVCRVEEQTEISRGIFDLRILCGDMAEEARAGQFVNIYCRDKSRLLPRPISICGIDRERGLLRLVYRAAGAGTREMSEWRAGDEVRVMGPLGKGFPLERAEGKRVFLVGGGIGIPPMLETAGQLSGRADLVSVLGYRSETFLCEEFEACGQVLIATEDGSVGTRGTILDAIRDKGLSADLIFACGPAPMLRALKTYAAETGIELWLSLEERMACGIGACLACTCGSADIDDHSKVRNKRVCADGPVFPAWEVEI